VIHVTSFSTEVLEHVFARIFTKDRGAIMCTDRVILCPIVGVIIGVIKKSPIVWNAMEARGGVSFSGMPGRLEAMGVGTRAREP